MDLSSQTMSQPPLLSSSSSLGTDGTDDGSLDLDGQADGNVEARLTWMTQRMASTTPRLTWMDSTKARPTAPWTQMVLPMEQTMARASLWHRAIAIIIQLKTPGMGACNSTEGGPEGSDFCRIFRSCFFATLHSFRLSYDIFDTSQQTTSATSTSTRHNGPLLSSSSSSGTDGTDDGSQNAPPLNARSHCGTGLSLSLPAGVILMTGGLSKME